MPAAFIFCTFAGVLSACTDAFKMKITKKKYIQGFFTVVALLAVVRLIFPSVAKDKGPTEETAKADTVATATQTGRHKPDSVPSGVLDTKFFDHDGNPVRHRLYSVPGFSKTFPDSQQVQVAAAQKYGVSPVADHTDATRRRQELVYIGSNPYYYVRKLGSSIPYLVPRAAVLLQDIGRTFYDSLQVKGVPLHQIMVTSVLRSKADVAKLRSHNGNATENSCHLYGTTFDISYNKYRTVEPPGEKRRQVRDDTLKYVLSEVLRDMRNQGRCYIKYEVHQGCFHVTVR